MTNFNWQEEEDIKISAWDIASNEFGNVSTTLVEELYEFLINNPKDWVSFDIDNDRAKDLDNLIKKFFELKTLVGD